MHIKEHAGFYLRLLTVVIVILEISLAQLTTFKRIVSLTLIIVSMLIDAYNYSPWSKPHANIFVEYCNYLIFILLGIVQFIMPKTILVLYLYFMVVVTAELTVKQTSRPKHIVITQFVIYFCIFSIPNLNLYNFSSWLDYARLILSPYTIQFWSIYLISYLYLNLLEKNRAIDALNKELMNKVDQLQDYSTKIKELTLIEERQRISQNLHDMLGHSLIGLRLHLEALNQFIDTDPQKSHQILDKSKSIIDHSLVELRETVNELNETKELADLKTALEELCDSISVTEQTKVDLKMYFDVNKLDISVKDLIYKTCQEFITNSIKHGHSSLVTIKLRMNQGKLIFDLTNNGQDAGKIVASNGINGIKDRVDKLNGQVTFSNNQPSGFKADINIPIGVITND